LGEIAQATGGFYFTWKTDPLEQQIQNEGWQRWQAAEMDVRLSRRAD